LVHSALDVALRGAVVVVPRADAAEVLELVQALIAREASRLREIRDGVLFKSEIDEALRKKGVVE
jgi:hypothetical protein